MINETMLRILAVSDPKVFAETIRPYGLHIIGIKDNNPLRTKVQKESIASIASAITEDTNTIQDISQEAVAIKRLAEEYGYIVQIIETTAAPVKAPPRPGTKPFTIPSTPKEPKRDPFRPVKPAVIPDPKARRKNA